MGQQTPPPPMVFGFQDDGQLRNGNYQALDRGRAIGGKAVRLIVSRECVQRSRDSYDFSTFDAIVNEARARGIRPQLVLDNIEGFKKHGMGDPAKYEQFVKAIAHHFRGRVGTYSLVNEPDLKMAPDKYRQLYVRGQRALVSVDPHAKVLFGELSSHGGMEYARKVIGDKGLTASGFAIHPYQGNDPLAPPKETMYKGGKWGIGRTGQMQSLIRGMNIHTRAGTTPGLYFTEFGYDNNNPDAPAFWSRALQKAERAGVRQLIAYTLTGSPNSPDGWDTGLVNPDGSPRPAYDALRQANTAPTRVLRRKR